MSDYTLAAVAQSLSVDFSPEVFRTANRVATLLKFFRATKGGGQALYWDAMTDGAFAENHSDGSDITISGADIPTKATLPWGLYRAGFLITDLAASASRSSTSPADLLDPMKVNMMSAVTKLAAALNSDAFAGAGTGTLLSGLSTAIDDSNTYAGINRSSNSFFRSKVIDPGTLTAPTIALIRSDLGAIYDQCGEAPDVAIVSTAVWNAIANLFTEQVRQNLVPKPGAAVQLGNGNAVTMDIGVKGIYVDDCLFIRDWQCTSNVIYYLNSRVVEFVYLPVDLGDFADMMPDGAMMDGGGSTLPYGMQVVPIARTGSARKLMLPIQMQLKVGSPKHCGVRKNVAA